MGFISTDFCLFSIFLETLVAFKPVNPLPPIADLHPKGYERFLQCLIFLCAHMFIPDDFAIHDLKVAF